MPCKDYGKSLCDSQLKSNDIRAAAKTGDADKGRFLTSIICIFLFAGGAKSASDVARAPLEVMDVEGVHLEEGRLETSRGEDSELSLSFQGYVAELRQCQSKMRNAKMPHGGHSPPEGPDCAVDLYKATVVWRHHCCTLNACTVFCKGNQLDCVYKGVNLHSSNNRNQFIGDRYCIFVMESYGFLKFRL